LTQSLPATYIFLSSLKILKGLKMLTIKVACVSLLAIFAATTNTEAATLAGNTIAAQYFLPTTSDIYPSATGPASFVVGDGVEGSLNIEDVTWLDIDFSAFALLITINTVLTNPSWNTAEFNGPGFSVLSGNPFSAITSVTASNGQLVTAALTGGSLFVNWGGTSYNSGDTVSVTFDEGPAPVPLPAGLPLLASALLLGGFVARRKRHPSIA
jgi:hypothetical protein